MQVELERLRLLCERIIKREKIKVAYLVFGTEFHLGFYLKKRFLFNFINLKLLFNQNLVLWYMFHESYAIVKLAEYVNAMFLCPM